MGKAKGATNTESLGYPLVTFLRYICMSRGGENNTQSKRLNFSPLGSLMSPCFLLDIHSKGKPGLTGAMKLHNVGVNNARC